MTPPANADLVERLRLRQAHELLQARIVELPPWIPAIVDSAIGPIPVLTSLTLNDVEVIFLTWLIKDGSTTSTRRWELCRILIDHSVVSVEPLTSTQLALILKLVKELKAALTAKQLEGLE